VRATAENWVCVTGSAHERCDMVWLVSTAHGLLLSLNSRFESYQEEAEGMLTSTVEGPCHNVKVAGLATSLPDLNQLFPDQNSPK